MLVDGGHIACDAQMTWAMLASGCLPNEGYGAGKKDQAQGGERWRVFAVRLGLQGLMRKKCCMELRSARRKEPIQSAKLCTLLPVVETCLSIPGATQEPQ